MNFNYLFLKKYSFSKNKFDYLLFYLLFFFAEINWTETRQEMYIFLFIIAGFLFFRKNNLTQLAFFRIAILYVVLFILQLFMFGKAEIASIIRQFMYIIYPLFLVYIFKEKFAFYFANIMVFISIFSFIFFIPSALSKDFHQLLWDFGKFLDIDVENPLKTSFIIHTVEPYYKGSDLLRNSALFKEPGYFSAYLSLAFALNTLITRKLFNKKNIVYVLAVISSFSTAGYLTISVLIGFYIIFNSKLKLANKIFTFIFIVAVFSILFTNLDFLSDKITSQYEEQTSSDVVIGRFGATIMNLKEVSKYPITGKGLIPQTRFDESDFYLSANKTGDKPWLNTNAWSNWLVKLGVVGFCLFIIWYVTSIKHYVENMGFVKIGTIFLFLSILIPLFAQSILETPVFYSFMYMGYAFGNTKNK